MKIRAFVDFFHGSTSEGSSRKFEAGQVYDVPDEDANIIIAAGWAGSPERITRPRMIVEPVAVKFNPPK